jgi:hypothetical protein
VRGGLAPIGLPWHVASRARVPGTHECAPARVWRGRAPLPDGRLTATTPLEQQVLTPWLLPCGAAALLSGRALRSTAQGRRAPNWGASRLHGRVKAAPLTPSPGR